MSSKYILYLGRYHEEDEPEIMVFSALYDSTKALNAFNVVMVKTSESWFDQPRLYRSHFVKYNSSWAYDKYNPTPPDKGFHHCNREAIPAIVLAEAET